MKHILSILTLFICLTITAQKGQFPKLEGHTLEGNPISVPIAGTKKFTIVGGIHITLLPNKLASEFDVGVLGEGEQTFLELLQTFKKYGIA
jgi:hypothetical protein